jgi:hypothetical protein
VHLVADEAGALVDEVDALAEAVLEVDLMAFCDRDSVRDYDHRASLRKESPSGKRGHA